MRLYCAPLPCNNGWLNVASKFVFQTLAKIWLGFDRRQGIARECYSFCSSCCCGMPNVVPSAVVFVMPHRDRCPGPAAGSAGTSCRPCISPVLRLAILFPEHAGIELSVEFAQRGFRAGAIERRADRKAGRRFDERRIVGRGHGDRADERPRDRFRRRRNDSAAELPHHLAVAQRDLHGFVERQVPDLVIFDVLERQRRQRVLHFARAAALRRRDTRSRWRRPDSAKDRRLRGNRKAAAEHTRWRASTR